MLVFMSFWFLDAVGFDIFFIMGVIKNVNLKIKLGKLLSFYQHVVFSLNILK